MEGCSRTVKESMCGIGIVSKRRCGKPVFQDGLCHYHYTRMISKQRYWGDRKEYRTATVEDFERSRSLKLKASNVHHIYRYRKHDNSMLRYDSKTNKWIKTDVDPNPELFCVKWQ